MKRKMTELATPKRLDRAGKERGNTMKIKLRPSTWTTRPPRLHSDHDHADWQDSQPFVVNPRGIIEAKNA